MHEEVLCLGLQSQYDEVFEKYLEERRALEEKYWKLFQPYWSKRSDVINGRVDPAQQSWFNRVTDREEDPAKALTVSSKAPKPPQGIHIKGIPNFWLQAMKNNQVQCFGWLLQWMSVNC